MAYQAVVTLTSLNHDIVPYRRIFTLGPDRNCIQVGRASKSPSKGLVAAWDNAWFDSPVMSRNHAEIAFNNDNQELTIEDTEAMHGTRLNEHKITPGTPMPLHVGDMLVFGTEVQRGPQTFRACKFRVEYDLVPIETDHRTNTFEVPYSSDIEEDEEVANGEDYYGVEDIGQAIARGIEAKVKAVIDLTQDEERDTTTSFSQDDAPQEDLFDGSPSPVWDKKPHAERSSSVDDFDGSDPYSVPSPIANKPEAFENAPWLEGEDDDLDSAVSVESDLSEEGVAAEDENEGRDISGNSNNAEIPSGQGHMDDFSTGFNSQSSAEAVGSGFSFFPSPIVEVSAAGIKVSTGGDTYDVESYNIEESAPFGSFGLLPQFGETFKAGKTILVSESLKSNDLPSTEITNTTSDEIHDLNTKAESSHVSPSMSTSRPTSPEPHKARLARSARAKTLITENSRTIQEQSLKRKSDQITELVSQEEQAWHESSKVAPGTIHPLPAHPTHQERNNLSGTTGSRSTKRLKRFAEAVGYVALGGVAVGAGLFSLLVATAPEFA